MPNKDQNDVSPNKSVHIPMALPNTSVYSNGSSFAVTTSWMTSGGLSATVTVYVLMDVEDGQDFAIRFEQQRVSHLGHGNVESSPQLPPSP